jgi:4-amino-4-deoxy-L-arabinose transferase-like glycosyltransferase
LLILGAAGLHIAYLTNSSSLDLAPDEAHYWDWSRHLDWSYYSKGPLVAYLIRLGCAVTGSPALAGNVLAVRLPAVICGGLLLASLYILTLQVYGRASLAAGVVTLALTLPIVAAGASLMTIDAPYTCCWGWALVLGYHAIFRRAMWAWPLLGLVIGLGILAKYTMILWLPSVGLFLLSSPTYRSLLFHRGLWIATSVAALCCVPILLWNMQHDWVSLRHVEGQAGVGRGEGVRWWGPVEFLEAQCALLLIFWFVAWARAMFDHRPWNEPDAGRRYLWWMSAPMFVVFLVFSLKTREEPNWPVTAYLSGLVLATEWLVGQLAVRVAWYRRLTAALLATAAVVGLGVTMLMHHSQWIHPLLRRVTGPPSAANPFPLRHLDPTCRLRGWRELARAVDQLRAELQRHGIEAVIAGTSWTLPGELGFYCSDHPATYSVGLALGDRHSQYDLWHPNPVADVSAFTGMTFIIIGEPTPRLLDAFERVDPPHSVFYQEHGEPLARWTVTVCRGFRGFPPRPDALASHF